VENTMQKTKLILAAVLAGCMLAALPASAQTNAAGGGQGAGSTGTTSGPSEMQRVNPPTTSNKPADLSGNVPGGNTGTAVTPVPQAATTDPTRPAPEVPRSDSAR
jgi:uncharacterized membrane protein